MFPLNSKKKKNSALVKFFDTSRRSIIIRTDDENLYTVVNDDEDVKNEGEITSCEIDEEEDDEAYSLEDRNFTFRSVPKLIIEVESPVMEISEEIVPKDIDTESFITPRTEDILRDSIDSFSDLTKSMNDFSDYEEDHPEILNLMMK